MGKEYKYSIQEFDKFYHLYRTVVGEWDWELVYSASDYDTVLDFYNWIPDYSQGDLIKDGEIFGMGLYGS